MDKLVILEKTCVVLARLFDLEHPVAVFLPLEEVTTVRVPVRILVHTVPMELVIDEVASVLISIGHRQDALVHHIVTEFTRIDVPVGEGELALALYLTLHPLTVILVPRRLVPQLALPMVFAHLEAALVLGPLLFVRLGAVPMLYVVVDGEGRGRLLLV